MPQFSESVEIKRPPEEVWKLLAQPERWMEGYQETVERSPGYPAPDTKNDHVYRTRMKENVSAQVTRSDPPSALEETQEGKTFSRKVRYSLAPSMGNGTFVRVEDDLDFKGFGKLAAPIASRDVRSRWAASLHKLKAVAEAGGEQPA
jgi:uncharacterized protein YndB with AHSA1/START domain